MALRLGDVEKNHKKREEVHSAPQKVTLRPWQGLEERDDIRRLKKSEIAIDRAREIARRNNEMAQKLREGHVSEHITAQLDRELAQREDTFSLGESEGAWGQRVAIKRRVLSFFKDVFRPSELN